MFKQRVFWRKREGKLAAEKDDASRIGITNRSSKE